MNEPVDKRRKRQSRKERALEQQRLERENLQHEIYLQAKELASEMNLRLLLDREVGPRGTERMLFVESVTVIGIVYPVKQGRNFFHRTKLLIQRIFTYIVRSLHPNRGGRPRLPQQFR